MRDKSSFVTRPSSLVFSNALTTIGRRLFQQVIHNNDGSGKGPKGFVPCILGLVQSVDIWYVDFFPFFGEGQVVHNTSREMKMETCE